MNKILLFITALLVASTAHATISRNQAAQINYLSACPMHPYATFTAMNTTANDTFVVWAAWSASGTVTANVSDANTNVYATAVGPTSVTSPNLTTQIFYATNNANTTGFSFNITVNFSSYPTACSMVIVDYSGLRAAQPVDVVMANSSSSSGTQLTSNSVNPTFASEVVFGAGATPNGSGMSAGAGFNSIAGTGTPRTITEDAIVFANVPQTATATLTSGGSWVMQIVTFRDAGVAFSGDVGIQGPRPYVDVTAYGAKGDSSTDDTAAIQSAINAACQPAGANGGGVVYFPPTIGGYYYLTQPPQYTFSSATITDTGTYTQLSASVTPSPSTVKIGQGIFVYGITVTGGLPVFNGWGTVTNVSGSTVTWASQFYFPGTSGSLTGGIINASPVDLTGCGPYGVTLAGGDSSGAGALAFSRNPTTSLIVQNSSSGGLAPAIGGVFVAPYINGGFTNQNLVTLENLNIIGYNQALQINNATGVVLHNVGLAISNGTPPNPAPSSGATGELYPCITQQCVTDTTPLAVYSSFWIWADQLTLDQPGTVVTYPVWAANTNYSTGAIISYDGYLFQATNSGKSGSSAPSWPLSYQSTIVDGIVPMQITWLNVGIEFVPCAVFAQTNGDQDVGLIDVYKGTCAGRGFLMDVRDTAAASQGNIVMKDFINEGNGTRWSPFFTLLNTSGANARRNLGPFVFEDVGSDDCLQGSPFFVLNTANNTITPPTPVGVVSLLMKNATGCGLSVPVLDVSGNLSNAINEGNPLNPIIPINASGASVGPMISDNLAGRDFVANGSDSSRFRTDYMTAGVTGPPIRLSAGGSSQATLGIDPGLGSQAVPGQGGVLFGDGTNPGYNAAIQQVQGGTGSVDVVIPRLLPPTMLNASPGGTGGSGLCVSGTRYYLEVAAYQTISSLNYQTTPSIQIAYTLPSGNNQIALSWIAPLFVPSTLSGGYVVYRDAQPGQSYEPQHYDVVTGLGTSGGTVSYTDICGTASGSPNYSNATFSSIVHAGQFGVLSTHLGQQSYSTANEGDIAGVATLTGGTVTVTFKVPYYQANPVCMAWDSSTGNPVTIPTGGLSQTSVKFSGTASDTIMYICFGNPY